MSTGPASNESLKKKRILTMVRSGDRLVDEFVDHLEAESRYALLGVSNSIMVADITANRVLDAMDLPK